MFMIIGGILIYILAVILILFFFKGADWIDDYSEWDGEKDEK